MLYGQELRESIERAKARTIECMENRDERIANWQTDEDDCFMSIRVDDQAMANYNMQLKILDGDGTMPFDALKDQDGKEIRYKWVSTKYGTKLVANGVWANSMKALLKKTGWHIEEIRVPVWTKFCPNGSGMLGVYSGSYEQCRWHTNMVTGEYVGFPE